MRSKDLEIFIEKLKVLKTNRSSPAYRRAKSAGFTIGDAEFRGDFAILYGQIELICPFECVCGKKEMLHRQMFYDEPSIRFFLLENKEGWDVAQELENFGSFSEAHLRDDGYSEEAIRQIRYVYDLEDELRKLRIRNRELESIAFSQGYMVREKMYDFK